MPLADTDTNCNMALFARISRDGRREVVGSYLMPGSLVPYTHSFSLTDKYAVVALWSIYMDLTTPASSKGFMRQLQRKGGTEGSTILVFDLSKRGAAPVHVFQVDQLFAYHHIYAWETAEGDITFDVTGYRSPDIINGDNAFTYLPNMRDIAAGESRASPPPAGDGHTFRFVLPMADTATCEQGQVQVQVQVQVQGHGQGHVSATQLVALDEAGLDYTGELLSMHEKWRGKEYQFAYGFTGFAGPDAQNVSRGGARIGGLSSSTNALPFLLPVVEEKEEEQALALALALLRWFGKRKAVTPAS